MGFDRLLIYGGKVFLYLLVGKYRFLGLTMGTSERGKHALGKYHLTVISGVPVMVRHESKCHYTKADFNWHRGVGG